MQTFKLPPKRRRAAPPPPPADTSRTATLREVLNTMDRIEQRYDYKWSQLRIWLVEQIESQSGPA